MSLSEQELIEIESLCDELADGRLSSARRERLSTMLRPSEAARQFYVRRAGLSASLFDYAGEAQSNAPDTLPATPWRRVGAKTRFYFIAAAAAVLALAVGLWSFVGGSVGVADPDVDVPDLAAQLTASDGCVWRQDGGMPGPDGHVRQGQTLELAQGHAELTFDCGAQLVLDAPVTLEIESAWEATLLRGTVHAHVPEEAIGFKISHAAVDVVDLGTEFTMCADDSGGADVYVTKGEVETTPHGTAARDTIRLTKDEGRHFGRNSVTRLADGMRRFGSNARPAKLARLASPLHYAHWTFDECQGLAAAVAPGTTLAASAASIQSAASATESLHRPGRWNNALWLDGGTSARIEWAGLSADAPRTVACWVCLPADRSRSGGAAMLSWLSAEGRAGAQPVQVAWNASPARGAVGALWTECARDGAIGTTNLRDGRWHHIAVVVVPSGRGNGRMHVRQYVDGRLEQTVIRRAKKLRRDTMAPVRSLAVDGLQLGRSLESSGSPPLVGALDELFVADRAMSPQELKRLMLDNRCESDGVAIDLALSAR